MAVGYYVTAIDAGKVHLMAGPFADHAAALAAVEPTLAWADALDGRAWFMAWGTSKLERDSLPLGARQRLADV